MTDLLSPSALAQVPEVKAALLRETTGDRAQTLLTKGYHGHLRDGFNPGHGCGWCDRLGEAIAAIRDATLAAERERLLAEGGVTISFEGLPEAMAVRLCGQWPVVYYAVQGTALMDEVFEDLVTETVGSHIAGLVAKREAVEAKLAVSMVRRDRLEAEHDRLKTALGFGEPYPVLDVLRVLGEFAERKLTADNYDGLGWEELQEAAKRAKEIRAALTGGQP